MLSTEIYKLDSKGKIRTWQYEVIGDGFRTIAGLQDGQKVVSELTICTPKSQATAEAQALFEAKAEETKKLKRDYHATIESTAKAKYFAPMLAEEYEAARVRQGDMAQPKLDGVRCVATKDGLRSRKGEPISSCPHISEDLADFFAHYPDVVLDGELYNHDFKDNFNELVSIIRKQTPTAAQLERARRDVEFHVYDLVDPKHTAASALERNAALFAAFEYTGPSIQLVPTQIIDTDAQVRVFFSQCVDLGYEGAMIRTGTAPYQQKRTKALMKFKEFKTAEFPVVRIEEGLGNWAGFAKRAVCTLPDGREFGAGIKGNKAFTKELLTRDVKVATIRYFELTPDGVPRFPVAIDFDRPDA